MSKRRTREKLLSYLSSESLRQGSLEFDIPFDRQQLADYLCIERSAMSAELSRLQKTVCCKPSAVIFASLRRFPARSAVNESFQNRLLL